MMTTFIISFKDNYSSLSTHIADSLNNLFVLSETNERKKFGISKISLDLAKSLLNVLGGKFYLNPDQKKDSGFIFPLNLATGANDNFLISDGNNDDISNADNEEIKIQSAASEPDFEEEKNEIEEVDKVLVDEPKLKEQNIPQEIINETPADESKDEMVTNAINGYSQEHGVDLSQLSCLYIEDQIDSQILFSLQMKDLADIKYAVSFEEALPLLNNNKFDFILIDINILGEYNGLDALRMIHRLPDYEKLPIIAVTSYVLPGDQDKFIAAGFNDFISKPIFREKVIASLDRIFLMQM